MRAKHGHYDHTDNLPDNTMQPVGSGVNVWLQEEILARLGNEQGQALIDLAAPLKEKRYKWLVNQMIKRGYADLAEEYNERQKADAARHRLVQKEKLLIRWRQQLEQEEDAQRRVFLRQQIAKCERYLEEHKKISSQHP